MTVIVGGHETGLQDTSLALLNRNDRTNNTEPGHGEQPFVNVSNGNLLIQQQDVFLPSLGDDYFLTRTYNARGRASDAHQHEDARWTFSTTVRLDVRNDGGTQYFEVEYGDGSFYDYQLDSTTGLYVSTDGAGAFETIEDLGTNGNTEPSYVLTRSDQTKLYFDSQGRLLQLEDTNGVTVDYIYANDRLQQVLDDQGHVLNYIYQNGVLFQVTDESEGVLVEYHYDSGRLSEVIDRYGHSTQYFYTNDGFLERIVLPNEQVVDGQLETYDNRELNFVYDTVNWRGNNQANAHVVTQITDASGGITTFDYDFNLVTPGSNSNGVGHTNSNGKGHFKHGDGVTNPDGTPSEDKFFLGGTTTVVDALGNNRAFSNDQEYVDWRTANGYYATYDANQAATDPNFQSQVDAIRNAHALTYTYRDDGYITEVVDQQGFHTSYAYDDQDNLIRITDRNGWGATNSDSDYFRTLRAELGITDGAGNGKLVASLTQQEIDDILEAFTSHFEYDDRGNLTKSIDNADNETTFTYTSFNKLESSTSAVGNSLVTSDEQFYQDKRVELGYAALVADLSAADSQAILDLHTTSFAYDANQNLIERTDPGGDITRFEYDQFGNQTKRIVFLDANDLTDPAKQQVTTFAYDGFGNNISATDAEGHQTFSEFDHFGNLTRFTDANGGETLFTYDADNRLLTVTDPEGYVTVNTYDAVGNRISVTDANGHTITRIYDLNNNLIATIDPSETDPLEDRTTQFEYDVVGNRTATVDAEGRRTEFTFNTRRELVEVLTAQVGDQNGNPTQYSSTFAYDGEGNRITTTNNRGFTTEIIYTQNNLIKQQTDPNGHITRFEYDANNNQINIIAGLQLTAAKRQVLQFSYDEEDQLVTQTDAEGNVTQFAYDAPGNRIAVTDGNGNTTEFEYDGNNRLIKEIRPEVIDPVTGNPVRYTVDHVYDGNGNEIETIDENGHSTKFTFDRDDRLVMVEDANGIKTVFDYDSRHNRTAVLIGVDATADANGHVTVSDVSEAQTTRFVYDEFNQLIAQIDGVGNALAESDAALYQTLRQELGYAALVADLSAADQTALRDLYTQHFAYDKVGNQISRTDNLDRVTSFQYDALNRLTTRTDAEGQVTGFRYDGNGNRTSQTDAEGRVTSFVYDNVDRLTDSTDPLGTVTHRDYDDFGNLIGETRAFGTGEARTSTFDYDLNNRVISQTDPEGHTQSFEYDAVGNRLRVTDGRGNDTQFVYNALNRNIKIIDPLNFETQFEYDGVGNRISLIDARGGITQFDYDPGNRRISTTDAEGRQTTFAYDVRGNRIEQRTAAGTGDEEVTTFEYDAENNLRRVIDAEGGITENDYDRVYNRTETTDANGHTTVSEFDAVDRVIRVTDAEGQVTEFAYDAVGNRLSQTDALGRVTQFEYDDNDRLIKQIAADTVETHFAYDSVGNRTSIIRAANTADAATDTFAYNLNDRLVSQTDAEGNTTSFVYDENNNRTVVTDPNGNATTYTYDENNRVTQIQDPEANTVQYAYDGNGNRVQITDGRGNPSTTYYNANNEVTLAVDAEGFATSFTYDNNGNVVSQTLHMQALSLPVDPNNVPTPATSANDQTTGFEYDKLNRVTARVDAEGFRTEFTYDAVGNRLQTSQYRDLAGTDIATTHSFYDDVNREISMVTAEGYLVEFTYDAVGNRTTRTVFDERVTIPGSGVPTPVPGDSGRIDTMVYDAVNRLVRETSPLGVHTDLEYDDRGNRTAIVEAAGTGDERRSEFVYDDADRLTQTIDALGTITQLSLDANGNVTQRREAFGTADERLSTFVYDGNNRTVSQTNALGITSTMSYDGNGNVVSMADAVGLPEERTQAFEYDNNNRRTAEVNGEGERTESTYDGAGNRTSLTLAPGLAEERTNTFEFDRDNRLVAGVDGEGVRTEYRYDGAGNKIETIQAVGLAGQERHSFYVYDLDNRLTQVTDPMGGITSYTYDVLGNQTEIVNANGGIQTNTFDAIGRLVSSLSAGDVLTSNSYDLRGNIVSTTQSFGDGSDSRTTTYGYDLLDQQTLVTDPEGFSTSIQYDAFGNQTLVTHGQYLLQPSDANYDATKAARAHEQTNAFAYDAASRLLSLTDGEGNITAYTYDAVGNRTSMTEAANTDPRTTTFSYDLASRLIETVTPEGGISQNTYDETGLRIAEAILQSDDGTTQVWINRSFEYDGNARLTAEIDPYGVRTEREYDAMGNQTVLRMAAGTGDERITRMEYDLNNRVSAEIDGEGHRSEFEYDSLGNRIKVTDALGRTARFYFDGSNNLVSILDAESYINAFSYDSAGNRTGEVIHMTRYTGPVDDFVAPTPTPSANDRSFTSIFDGNSRISQRIESDGSTTNFIYDAAGNLLQETQFANTSAPRDLFYQYDLNNRLAQFTDVDGTVTTFAYDGANNKLSETLTNTNDPNAVRQTTFEYDLNNRLVREAFDPTGLNLVQTITYDKVGNAVGQTDANNNLTQTEYDLNNRVTRQIDPLGNDTFITYDSVGNEITVTDANGNTTELVYDNNNRIVQEISPEVTIYTIDGGFETLRPTIIRAYDAAGNEVQVTDAAGFNTTRYFDSNDRLVAEINGDNALREWDYNAAGEQISETLYMTRLALVAHDPAVRPGAPAGDSRVTSMEYDLAGRVTRVIHPQIEVTTLADTNTSTPTFTTSLVNPEEVFVYDAFGNQVEIFDRNGNRTVAFYDAKDRLIAQIDPEGYLTEFDYDSQDNVLEQRIYTQALDINTIDPSSIPAAPTGEVYQTNRVYDAASRLIEEHSPQVEVFDPSSLTTTNERVITLFSYDGVGNQLSRTLASGSSQEFTEYNYYDANNRLVAVIDGNRVVNRFAYDANGNQTLAKRHFTTVAAGVDLTTLNGGTDFAALVGSNANDQELSRLYDALNRLSSETELMGAGSADDLMQSFGYDANGNRTRAVDEDGFVQQFSFNALGSLIRSISPEGTQTLPDGTSVTTVGSGSVYEYDVAGNQILAFTGQIDGVPVPASNLGATLGDDLVINWSLPTNANVQSYVVFDTASQSDINNYANQSAVQGTWFSTTGSASIPVDEIGAGDSLYFRVVTQDAAGSLTWTEEQVLTLPPRLTDVAVQQTGTDSLQVTADFESGTVNPQIQFGMPGATNSTENFVAQGGGVYTVDLTGVTNPQELVYRITWEDAAGNSYSSGEVPFEAQGEHAGISTTVTETTVMNGGTFHKLNLESVLPSSQASGLLALGYTWERIDVAGESGSASVEGVDSGLGYFTFDTTIGTDAEPLEPNAKYEVTLIGIGETEDVVLDKFTIDVGAGGGIERGASWTIPNVGDDQVVIVEGVRVAAERNGDRLLVDTNDLAIGTNGYSAFYGTANSDLHTTTITSTEVFETDNSTTPPTQTSLGFDVNVSAALTAAEAATVNGDVRLAWRSADTGTDFANDVAMTAVGSTFDTTLPELAAGEYDLKIYYINANGDEVIVDWLRVDTANAVTNADPVASVTIEASEVEGEISLTADDVVTVDPGLYSGPVGDIIDDLPLATAGTGNLGGSQTVDGSDTGYFTETQYNALNDRIATNAEDGAWREFSVDANGNVVVVENFGIDRVGTPVTTFSAYDGRNREVAQFAALTTQSDSTTDRAVTRFEYDVQDNVTKEIDARGGETTRTWNALGSQLTETDQLLNSTTFRYDRLGRRTAEEDALGNSRYSFYDTVGNLVQEVDGEGHSTTHTYDVFGRRTHVTNALNQTVELFYDHRDRLTSANDALGNTTSYEYDGRDNRTKTIDANGNESRQVWDGLGRVVDTVTFQNGQEIHERNSYDAYGNLVASTDGEGRVTSTIYGEFGRAIETIDQGGRRTQFEYDDFGRLTREFGPGTTITWFGIEFTLPGTGKDIQRTYDDAGRLLEVHDVATGVKTTYTYDIAGNRKTEQTDIDGDGVLELSEHERNISYEYDAIGQMVRWADGVTGMHTNYMWDNAGNLKQAFTDLGYDPDNEGLDVNTRFVDHFYNYDGNNRVTEITQRGVTETAYSFDAAGNRVMVQDANGNPTYYGFDANGRVTVSATDMALTQKTADWQYDDVGNVLRFRTFKSDGSVDTQVTKQYYENNRNFFTNDDGQQTTLTMDLTGRVTRTKLVDDGDTFYFDHIFNAAGLETQINARGKDVSGRTTNTYDANDQLIVSNKGEGDQQDRAEVLRFTYNNDGQILYRFHDTGEGNKITDTEFAYANGNPVGQTGNTEDNVNGTETLLDTGRYNLIQPLGEDFPDSTVTFFTAREGDSLQAIAAAVYGNPSLWFVLAEANGLDPNAPLSEGQRLQIPNTIESGRITADTHVVYDESEIIGSTLPNLKSDPDDGCGSFLAIIIVVIIAVVAVIATAGLASAFLGTAGTFLGLSGTAATIAAFAVAGAIVGAAAAIVQQGLFIALGYQDEFSWKAVAAGAVSGALSGAAQGVGSLIEAGKIAGDTVRYAKTAARALQVASSASKQLIENGKITSWASLASAAVGPVRGVTAEGEIGNLVDAVGTAADASTLATALQYVTPWLGAAESFIRTGEVSPGDWASAVGSTLGTALARNGVGTEPVFAGLDVSAGQLATNLIVGGVLSSFDNNAGEEYLANFVGNEIGNFIGEGIAGATGLTDAAVRGIRNLERNIEERSISLFSSSDQDESQRIDAPNSLDHKTSSVVRTVEETRNPFNQRTVNSGDTLGAIVSETYGVGYDEDLILRVAQLNGLTDPNQIREGQELVLPASIDDLSGIAVDSSLATAFANSNTALASRLATQSDQGLSTLAGMVANEPTPSVAAPTGQSFTEDLVQTLEQEGASQAEIQQLLGDPRLSEIEQSVQVAEAAKANLERLDGLDPQGSNFLQDSIETLEPVLETLAGINEQIEGLRQEHPFLAGAAEKSLQVLAGGPVKALVATIADQVVGDQLADLQGQLLSNLAGAIAERTNYTEERILYLVGGAAFGLSLVTGVKSSFGGKVNASNSRDNGARLNAVDSSGNGRTRPTWRQSELDVERRQPPGTRSQVSFRDGEEVPYGTLGSTRPDNYLTGKSVEVKNYSVENASGRSRLVRDVSNQARDRAGNLPSGTRQTLVVDVRGQNVNVSDLNNLAQKITDRSNGIISTTDIEFLRD